MLVRYVREYKLRKVKVMIRPFFLAVLALALTGVGPASAQREQDDVYRLTREGQIMQLSDILQRVTPRVGGKFIGSEFDADRAMYRLRYMDGGTVRNVDVDARTGRIIGRGSF